MADCHIPPLRSDPVEVSLFSSLGRNDRISSSSFRIVRWFSFSFRSTVVVVFSCNKLRLLIFFFLLFFVWYGTPPIFSVCFAKGNLLDFLTGSGVLGFSIYLLCSGVRLFSFGRSCSSSSMFVCIGFPSDLL